MSLFKKKLLIIFILLFSSTDSMMAITTTGTGNGTYDFDSVRADDSGGAGFKIQGDKFVISNILSNSSPVIYMDYSPNRANLFSATFTIKAENGNTMKTFTYQDLTMGTYGLIGDNTILDAFTIIFKDYYGNTLGIHSISSSITIPTVNILVSSLNFDNALPSGGYDLVTQIDISYTTALATSNYEFRSITIANVSSNTPASIPTATSVVFSGTLQNGKTLTGTYTYADADSDTESGSTFKWYASTDSTGAGKTAISGATSEIFTLTSNEVGKYISFEVTPKNANGTGSAVESSINSTAVATSNSAPTLNGAEANQAVNDDATINPFASIVLADADGDNISVSISLNNDAYGTLPVSTVPSGTIASVQASLRAIVFIPEPNRVAVGTAETTVLTITLNDGIVNSTPNSTTTVVSTSVNNAPTDMALSSTSVNQSGGENAVVGSLTTIDVDTDDSFTYVLVGGDGDTNNNSFNINSAELRANNLANLNAGTYSVRIKTTDATNATYEEKFTITVTDDIAPTLLTLSPADDTTSVAVDSDLVITLNTDVVNGTGDIVIKKSSDDSTVEIIVASSGLVTINGAVVTINPTTNLDFNTEYYIQIDNLSFKDSAVNFYAGISDTTSWSFRTIALDTDATLTAGTTVDESMMIALPSTVHTLAQKVNLFDFTISDAGTSDGLTTYVTQIVINVSGSTLDVVRGQIKWILNGTNVSNKEGTYDADNKTITFSSLGISVPNAGNETYILSAYFSVQSGLTDNSTFNFSINGSSDVTVDTSKTKMATGQSAITNSGNAKVDITATKFRFRRQPSNESAPEPT